MPTDLDRIVRLLNAELKIREMQDWSKNGLQVRASRSIHRVGLATDACIDSFKKAKRLNCDLLIVHHGIFLKGDRDTAGITKNRVRFLKKNHISLYGVHLPLDKSIEYGHNAHLLKLLGAEREGAFGEVGYTGYLKTPKALSLIVNEIDKGLNTKSVVWRFGNNKVRKIAAISGSGGSEIKDAIRDKVDLLVTGETSSWHYYDAKEGKINVIIAGHYKTETSGVKALGKLLQKKFGLETIFIDIPTGL